MKSFNFKKVSSISLASLTMFSGLCGLNSAKVSAAPVMKISRVDVKLPLTMGDLNNLIDYNPDVNFDEKQNDIKNYLSTRKDLIKEDPDKDAWCNSIVTFSKILFIKLKNASGYNAFGQTQMKILAKFYDLNSVSIFKPINAIKEVLLNQGSEEAKLDICSEIVADFIKSENIA